jgi:D-3-phosphoglycerate dehydrogenase
MKILVSPISFIPDSTDPASQLLRDFVSAHGGEIAFNPYGRPLSEDDLLSLLQGCNGFIAGLDYITKKVIDSCDNLRVISRYGNGYDRVDLDAARAKNIPVCITPGANSQAVADLTFALLLCIARKIPMLNSKTKGGQWVRSNGMEIYGKTIGIVGLGAIGKGVAKRAQGFSMRVLSYDPFIDKQYAEENGIEMSNFDELIKNSDVVSLHIPLTDETKCIISNETMSRMKKGAILINTARGGLIDNQAAYEYLKSGWLGGLGLDAYEEEPPKVSPLFELENVVLTPHTGAHTEEAVTNMALMSVQNLIDVLSGKPCQYIVNKT